MLTVSGLKFYASGTRKVCLGVEANVFLPRKINRTGDSVPALFCVSVPCTNHVQRHAVYCANYPSLHVPLFNFHISSFHISSASFYSSTARPTGCGGTMFSTCPCVRACALPGGSTPDQLTVDFQFTLFCATVYIIIIIIISLVRTNAA